ncbi:ribokinase [Coemansia mojavensis]|nr:ribokinase [Coemansia mojavensis]
MQRKIVSLASINIDEVYHVPHIVKPGETLSSMHRQQNAGGKGANASVAAARAGGNVSIVGKIGKDGLWVRDLLASSGANTDQITVLDDTATGHAIIQVDKNGENSIVLFPGANYQINEEDARKAFAQYGTGDWLLLTNETTGVDEAIRQARSCGMQILWNPAPMPANMISANRPVDLVDILVVNETELLHLAQQLDDIDLYEGNDERYAKIAQQIMGLFGTRAIIVTLGSEGSVGLCNKDEVVVIRMECAPIKKEQIKDTTAAGDTWVGYFAAELARLQNGSPESVGSLASVTPAMVEHAMTLATYASGITVTRPGAFPSIPVRHEVEAFFKRKELL